MSDKKTKCVDDKTSEHANCTDEYTMKDILESNAYARRMDRHSGLPVRPSDVWNIVDSNVLRDQVRPIPVKMPKHFPSSDVSVNEEPKRIKMSKYSPSSEDTDMEGLTIVKMQKDTPSSEVTNKEVKPTVDENITTFKNILEVGKDSVEMEVASSNTNEESETNVEGDLTGDMIVNVGKKSITDGETMTIQELWDLGWIM